MARREDKQTVTLPGAPAAPAAPYVSPNVNPEALDTVTAYKAGVAARRGGGLPKADMPVAGGVAPRIPMLGGQPAQEGMTMEQHAQLTAAPQQAAPQAFSGFVEAPPPTYTAPHASLDLRPQDVLPEQAKTDPNFIEGQGSMVAANQPGLAAKYGVIRGKQVITPQRLANPQEQTSQLRPETMHDLAQLQKLQEGQGLKNVGEAERDIPAGAVAAATAGNMPGDNDENPVSDTEKKRVEEALNDMDEFQFDEFRQAMMKDLLNSEDQKKIVESRLGTLDIGDLVTQQFIIQRVPIIPNKFEPTFITLDGETDLEIKRLIMDESKEFEVSDRYYLDKYSIMSIAAGLQAINGKAYPNFKNAQGGFEEDLFKNKLSRILRLPMHMIASIGVHQFWFEARVRSLFVAEHLGNG